MKSMISRGRLRRLLAHSLIAGAGMMATPLDADATTIDQDATDSSPDDEDAILAETGAELAHRLQQMRPFDATEVAAAAAFSSDAPMRLLLAEALVSPFALVGDDFVLDVLVRDVEPSVRATAARAAAVRKVHESPSQPLRVPVIDDIPGGRGSPCPSLSGPGCEVIGTSSRIGGREIAWLEHVDVVVAQHQPARVDGARLVELVRDHAPDLPAIVLRNPIERDELARVIDAMTVSRDR